MLESSSLVQADHEGAGQVPLDGEHRGGDAQVHDGAEEKAQRARDRCRRARRGRGARPYPRQPAPGAVARAVVGPERRGRGPVVLDDLSLSRGGLRRHDQHGAQAQGRLQAKETRAGASATRHSPRRSYAAFLALEEDACASAWEMHTVEGTQEGSTSLLTLLNRPSRLQLTLPLSVKDAESVAAALGTCGKGRCPTVLA